MPAHHSISVLIRIRKGQIASACSKFCLYTSWKRTECQSVHKSLSLYFAAKDRMPACVQKSVFILRGKGQNARVCIKVCPYTSRKRTECQRRHKNLSLYFAAKDRMLASVQKSVFILRGKGQNASVCTKICLYTS